MTSRTSAIAFAPAMRPHIALAVSDVDAARTFYEALLQSPPSKVRPGYVKFEPELPALNLTLNHDPEHAGQRGAAHFGVQVQSTDAVASATERLQAAGLQVLVEEQTTCCFAVQDKVWAIDPDGHRWEVFVVTEGDASVHSLPDAPRPTACCAADRRQVGEFPVESAAAACCGSQKMAAAKASACC